MGGTACTTRASWHRGPRTRSSSRSSAGDEGPVYFEVNVLAVLSIQRIKERRTHPLEDGNDVVHTGVLELLLEDVEVPLLRAHARAKQVSHDRVRGISSCRSGDDNRVVVGEEEECELATLARVLRESVRPEQAERRGACPPCSSAVFHEQEEGEGAHPARG